MSVEIAWKQNILVTDFYLLKSLLVVFGFGSQAFICGFSRQNINSVVKEWQLNFLPKTMNYINNDKTNQYFDIRTNSLNKILEKKKD